MKLRKLILAMTLGTGLASSPALHAAGFDELSTIRVLFVDLLDASACLQITPENCADLYSKASQYDVAKWVGALFCRPPQLDSCEVCYSHIDGKNIVGVLPVVHEVIREPAALHATSGSKLLQNHYVNDWGMLGSTAGADYQASSLSWYNRNVTSTTIQNWAPATVSIGTVNTSNAETSSKNPLRANFAYSNGSAVLTVPESLLSSNFTAPVVNVPFPSVVNLASGRAFNPLTNTYTATSYVDGTLGTQPLNTVSTSSTNGTLTNRAEPFVGNNSVTKAGYYYPARQYSYSTNQSRLTAANLTQCGVNYQVLPYGTVHPDFVKALATEYNRANTAGSAYVTPSGTTNGTLTAVTGNKGTFNRVTGLWSGAATYLPFDNFAGVDNANSSNNLAIASISSRIASENASISPIYNSNPALRQSLINSTLSTDSAPQTANP